ncbi:MAG: hypothetical protein WBL80_09135 [Erysipelotrichaceae bacterium]
MKKFLWGVLVGVFGYILSSSVMSVIVYFMENKLLGEPASLKDVLVFSLGTQFLVWLVLIPLSGILMMRYDLKASIYMNIVCIVICGALLGCYLGAVVF